MSITRFRPPEGLPLMKRRPLSFARRQRGASLIAAIFVITGLLVVGGLMTHLMVSGSEETINEWYSAQALYAAESGVEWSIYSGGSAATDQPLGTGDAWFTVSVTSSIAYAGGQTLYTITSVGEAGGTSGSPRAQRRIVVTYLQ